jgi:anti-sigma regulatory factor (Ser/Thr protein kinase)
MTPVLAIDPNPETQRLLDKVCAGQWRRTATSDDHTGNVLVVSTIPPPELAGAAKLIVIGPQGQALACLRAGAYGFLSEPITESAFHDLVLNARDPDSRQDDIVIESGRQEWVTLVVRCKMQALDRLVQWLRELEIDLPLCDREDIATAIRELVANSIEHGAAYDSRKTLRISRVHTKRARSYYIQDPGEGFSAEDLPHAAIANGAEHPLRHVDVRTERGIRPGGFGILMTRNLADELIYNEKGNEVLFIKYVPTA